MKKIVVFISCIALWAFIPSPINGASFKSDISEGDSIYIWSSPELISLAQTWVNGYSSTYPKVKMIIQPFNPKSMLSEMKSSGHIGIIYNDEISDTGPQNLKKIIVARDILVPIMNADNPYKEEIFKQGVSSESFSAVYSFSGPKEWGMLLKREIKTPLVIYKLKGPSAHWGLEEFLKTGSQNQNDMGIALEADELIYEIQNNPNAIGFCKLSQIIDIGTKDFKRGIVPIPIDINNNQNLDYKENIYKSASDLARGAWIGKYPHTLYRNIFAVMAIPSAKTEEIAFLEWIINDGQSSVGALGFSELIPGEKVSKLQSIYYTPVSHVAIDSQAFFNKNILFLLFAILIVVFIILAMNSFINKRPISQLATESTPFSYFNEKSILAPEGLFFDKHHTWAFMERKGLVRVGVDDFLQHTLGKITKVKMRKAGTRIKKGDPLISITQKGKKLEIYSPITGIIQENNEKLVHEPSLINTDPYTEGWVTTVKADDWMKETKSFLMGEKYKTELKKEFSRLKDFLTNIFKQEGNVSSLAILQDGGELKDAPLEQLGPEAWEEFQIQFMNRMSS